MAFLAELTGCYGEDWTDELLQGWFGRQPTYTFGPGPSRPQWLISLPALCDAVSANRSSGASTARHLLELAWASLTTLISSAAAWPSPASRRQQLDSLGEPLAALSRAAQSTQAADLRARIVDYCREHGDEMTSCVIRALRAAAAVATQTPPDDVFGQLASDQTARLRARLAQPARSPDDWSIELPDGCACELCGTLRLFLADPARRTFEWPLAQARRSHVHSRIDQAELPVSHQTRRQGRPYTLVLTKTAQLFKREAQQRTQDQADLDWLLEHWMSTRPEAPAETV